MKTALTEYQVATSSLKARLKKRGITYGELARRLKLSESGVKKILAAKDGSFQRVAEISRELGLTMGELLSGQDEVIQDLSYSPEQQKYLLAHPVALNIYWRLVYERQSPEEVKKLSSLSAAEFFAVLRKLDQLRLLQLLPGDQIRLPAVRQIRWAGGGPLIQKLYQEWSASFLRAVATPEPPPNSLFQIRYFRASQQTLNDFMVALKDLEKEFVRRAIQEMRTEDPRLGHLRWMSAIDDKSYLP